MKHSRYNYITPEKDGFFLLFNTAKETLVELDAEMLNYYESNTLDSETQAAMTELGFLVDDSFDELESLEATWRKNFEESSTIVLPLCMGGCTYCRLNQKKFCIPEKYFLDKYIKKLYMEATTKSGRGDFK